MAFFMVCCHNKYLFNHEWYVNCISFYWLVSWPWAIIHEPKLGTIAHSVPIIHFYTLLCILMASPLSIFITIYLSLLILKSREFLRPSSLTIVRWGSNRLLSPVLVLVRVVCQAWRVKFDSKTNWNMKCFHGPPSSHAFFMQGEESDPKTN